MNLIGKIIGNRYEILEEVGNGGMATVFKAKDHVLNRYVAVKVLKDEYTTDTDFIKRFNTEAQSAAGLSHANIVSIYDVGYEEEKNLYYIVMELVKGKTLKQIIKKDGVISWKWAVNIAMQIASALEEAHKNGIVHRDIKPHNIIITEDGIAKVTDFGIAKAVSNSTITAFGTTIGSVHYFSPEQAKGGITDAKSDLYSLGVVMFEMLTGKVPFDADTPVSVALKHMQEEPKEPIEINKNIPIAINQIVVKAMRKEPTERYQSATEMLKDLAKALKDPDGDFVIIENKDGEYTRVMKAVKTEKEDSKQKGKFFKKHPKVKILIFIIALILIFLLVFFGTKLALDGGIKVKVEVPNLVNMTLSEAESKAQSLGLKIESEEVASSEVEAGKIISQEPEFKENAEKVEKDTTIKVIVSKGPETFELPSFIGKKVDEAREMATSMGITLIEEIKTSPTVEQGYIIGQETAEGTIVKSGDEVKVQVSSGAEKTKVPYVIGMDEGTANATLVNANLKANITYINDKEKENGKVISQSVESGKEVETGTTVDITVNKIEKEEKTIKLILENVPEVAKSSENENSTNTTGKESNTAILTLIVNRNKKISEKSVTVGKSADLGTITGSGKQKIEIRITQNDKTKSITDEIDIDEYDNNATCYISDR